MKLDKLTGKDLRKIREFWGLTIAQMADNVGYSWSQLQRIEKGKQPVPRRLALLCQSRGYLSLLKKKTPGRREKLNRPGARCNG